MPRIFGSVPGAAVGQAFATRADLAAAGVHRPRQAGISGSQQEGCDSIVLSGGYEDDEDHWGYVLYTGEGARSLRTGRQAADQDLVRGNLALMISRDRELPVRVTRGAQLGGPYAPEEGYRYDGLYGVTEVWHERGRSGYRVWRFRLDRLATQAPVTPYGQIVVGEERVVYGAPARRLVTGERIVRDYALAERVKRLYAHHCQVCGVRLRTPVGPYAEAAHVKPLGAPHHGPDVLENLLCLCPNHHVRFDRGAFGIGDDLRLLGEMGQLTVAAVHALELDFLRYQRERFYWARQQDLR